MSATALRVSLSDDGTRLVVSGALLTERLGTVETAFARAGRGQGALTLDLGALEAIDTGGAWLIADLRMRAARSGRPFDMIGADPGHLALIDTVEQSIPDAPGEEPPERGFVPWLAGIGRATAGSGKVLSSLVGFLGLTLHRLAFTLLRPWRLRGAALVTHMQEAGLNAVPVVALMGFLIGVVLAFQGAAQLRQFGAEVFVVDLIAISILRELGIMLTAIIVAGRSGSAFTASIGTMKVQEEIDAMRTLGLDPVEVLVLPRVIALLVMLPVLGLIANLAGLFGGALMSWIELGVSPGMFITRLREGTDVWHLAVGMIKAPFFAVIIGVVACWQAMQVGGSSASVGQRTTASVVQSIFLVIAVDAMFSIFFAEIGV
ncbi:MAG: MlaE family lipid ABC transporter permease subunit [Rhodobacteraceae bacterium]|nr:MlaE family lipid ABC transporter permease subunit [Paracoccaceae bacterium]